MFECHICKSKNNLESHHINFQKDCDDVKVKEKPHIKKNAKYNLVILCSKCHDKIDRNEIIVKGWIKTSSGIMLDY
jgi:DNA mismatch repair protein MutS